MTVTRAGLSRPSRARYPVRVKGQVRLALVALVLTALLADPARSRADTHMLVVTVQAEEEADVALAQLADMMLREAVLESPGITLIEWTPSRDTLVATCQTATIDATCLDAVAARYHADFVLLPNIEHHGDGASSARHIEARLFDAREGVLSDPACAVLEAGADPEVALALVEVLLGAHEIAETEDESAPLDEGRSLGRHASAPLGRGADHRRHAFHAAGESHRLVPTASPCDTLSVLGGQSALCHGERDPAPEALTVLDGAGPSGYAALPVGEDHLDHEGHDDRIVDRMLERVRLSGRFSRSGVRVGAKIAF